jgi:hypothetical protein
MVLKADTRSGGGGGEVSILVVVPWREKGKGIWLGRRRYWGGRIGYIMYWVCGGKRLV